MQNGDNLKRRRFGPVNNGVVGVAGERPEPQRTAGEIGTGMAAHGSLSNKRAGIVDRLFDAAGGYFGIGVVVTGDVGPDVENIGFRERRESVDAHSCLEGRFRCALWTHALDASYLSSPEFHGGPERRQ